MRDRLPIHVLDPTEGNPGEVPTVSEDGTRVVYAPGGGSLTVQDENGTLASGVTQIDFQGAGVTATAGTGEVVVTIPGGGGGSSAGLFRGEWAPDELAFYTDFPNTTLPPGFAFSQNGGQPTISSVAASGLTGAPSGAVGAVKLNAVSVLNTWWAKLTLDLSALGIAGVTRVLCHVGATGNSLNASMKRDGVNVWQRNSSGAQPFIQVGATSGLTSSSLIEWEARGTQTSGGTQNPTLWVTAVEVRRNGSPYMLGEFVTHLGKLWKSNQNVNAGVPGTSGWTQVIGALAYATPARPAASSLPVGTSLFDTTLGKPVWTDGATWRDATGAAV